MADFKYASPAGRINSLKGEILGHAMHEEVLAICGMQKNMGRNKGDNVIYRRYLPYGATATDGDTINRPSATANAHVITEGVTPGSDTLVAQDITATQAQYGCLYMYTDKTALMYEDDVPAEMKQQTGERMGLVREMVRYGKLKGGTNTYYAGGTTRATVDEPIKLPILRRVAKNLLRNHAKMVRNILAPSPDFNTTAVEKAFAVFVSSDAEPDIRDLPGFKHCSDYGQRKVIHENELGSCERFRFVVSAELTAYADSGAAVGSDGLVSTTGTSNDVYPFIMCGQDAWVNVALRGAGSFDVTHIPVGQKDKNDPHGQRGYIGAIGWFCCEITNQGWMAVLEAGVTDV